MTIDFRDLPAYHWMTDDAREKDLVQGREEGREEGRKESRKEGLAGLRLAAVAIIEKSFPTLSKRAQKQLELIQHTAPLTKLITRIYGARTSDGVKRYLLEALGESVELD
ncbi:MAG TPA: hypothetical protein VGM01_04720 [Ktedonobacteraceae bacterium]|jgi:hypothetical protein